jgi:hypothetical protein
MHVYVMYILIYMSEKMVSVTPSVLYPHNGDMSEKMVSVTPSVLYPHNGGGQELVGKTICHVRLLLVEVGESLLQSFRLSQCSYEHRLCQSYQCPSLHPWIPYYSAVLPFTVIRIHSTDLLETICS